MKTIDPVIKRLSMDLFTPHQFKKLIENGRDMRASHFNIPYAYIMTKGSGEWLISELYEYEPDLAFGLQQKPGAKPALGYIDLKMFDKLMEDEVYLFNNLAFSTDYKISVFKYVADQIGQIVTKREYCKKLFDEALKL